VRLWRISEFASLDGVGGLLAPGRWNRKGRPIVYMAETSALAMLEVLAGYDVAETPETFQLLEIDVPDGVTPTEWPAGADHRDTALTADWGDAFLRAGTAALARVPSVIAPQSWNWLLNPLHADAALVRLVRAQRWPWDARLFER
jgi:RES domain-containing protein